MTVPVDNKLNEVVDLQASIRALQSLPDKERFEVSVSLASFFVEFAAFEMAPHCDSAEVADVIEMAARLERIAQRLVQEELPEDRAQDLRTF